MAAVSKSEYLKRYMSKKEIPKEDRKKKKKIKSSKDSKLKIIDDDFDLKNLKPDKAAHDDEFNEEGPTVAEFIDERPQHVQQLEEFRKNSRWKILGGDDEDEVSGLDYGVISQKQAGLQRSDFDKVSAPSRRRHDSSNSDSSNVRRNHEAGSYSNNKNTDRKLKRHDSDSDDSATKIDRHSTVNRIIDSNSDNSPPRKKSSQHHYDSEADSSPRRKPAKIQNGKSSPKPQILTRVHTEIDPVLDSDNSPPRRRIKRHDSDSDSAHSPRRKMKLGTSDSDQSPPRKMAARSDADQSPPRRKRRDSGSSDQSPPRRKQAKLSSDKNRDDSQNRKLCADSDQQDEGQSKAKKTLGGAKAGLSSAKEMQEEAKKLRDKEESSFQNIDADKLGRNAKTVVRDKETGKRKDLKAEEAKNEEEAKRKEEQMEKYKQWGKGLKQQAITDSRLQDQVFEASKPLARFRDDKDLNTMLRLEVRMEDPMFAFIQKRKEKEAQKSGQKKQKELPKYKGAAPPPNRYNLLPGYRWDGVDRSNGFEKKIFASLANKKAVQEMAYKWSTEDM